MSFDEEWANLKAEALARQSAGMQLNQLPADAGGSPGGVSADGTLDYNSASINGNANLLIEIAGFLHEGRPDGDLCTLARDPRSHSDVAAQVERFGRFADDQYQDAVALFAALSTRLRTAGSNLVTVDDDRARQFLDTILLDGSYIPPEAK
ncbi:hypothetical protein ACIPQH_22330 [Streptomyces rubiginosohelvolus]|uniref:hypothetical protein n=1 Tax=Streptomyces TaxID=1883 RepID=UPI001CD2A6CD|nr:hypothetical protein [Streptomyces sp. 7G]MCA1272543.1 hypothetical protein [Streptomyces sp. 7G]